MSQRLRSYETKRSRRLNVRVELGFLIFVLWPGSQLFAQPTPPASVTVIAPYNGQVNLQWIPGGPATAYQIFRTQLDLTDTPTATPTGTLTPVDTPTPIAIITAVPSPSYTDYQVTNGQAYLYQIAGQDAGGLGSPATTEAFPFSVPIAVQPLTVTNLHSDALDLLWGVPNSTYPVTLYQIYRYAVSIPTPTGTVTSGTATPTPQPVPAATVTFNATPIATVLGISYTDMSVGSSTWYYYVVQAMDSQGNLGQIPATAAGPGTPETLAPHAPTLSGLVSQQNGYGVQLLWDGPVSTEGVTQYQISINGTATVTIAVTPSVSPTPTYSYADTSIQFSSPTTYQVIAFNSNGTSSSNQVIETLNGASLASGAIATPDASTTVVTLTWGQATPGTYGSQGYWIFKSLNGPPVTTPTITPSGAPTPPTATPTPLAVLIITPSTTPTLSYVDKNVTNASGLTYWVQPFDSLQKGGSVYAAPFFDLGPTPVANVSAQFVSGNNKVAVTWQSGGQGFYGPIQNYYVYRESSAYTPTPAVTLTPVAVLSSSRTSFNDYVPATPNATQTPVVYQVGAVDGMGNVSDLTTYSNPVTLVNLGTPAVPKVVSATQDGGSVSFIIGNPSSDQVSSYSIYGPDWPTLTITPTPVATIIPTSQSVTYVNTSAANWVPAYNYVEAVNNQGTGAAATLGAITVPNYQVTAQITPGIQQVYVSWTLVPTPSATPGVDSYGMYRSLAPSACFTPIATVGVGTSVYEDAAVTPGSQYYYRVTARSNDPLYGLAESPLNQVYPAPTPTPQAVIQTWPNPPAQVTAVGGVTQTTLYWAANAAPESVLSYVIYRNGTPTVTVTPSPTLSVSFAETPGTVSYYQLMAQNASGSSGPSSPVSVLSQPLMTPIVALTPPPGFTPTPGVTPAVPQLVWISGLGYSGSVSGYTIYRSTDSMNWSYVNQVAEPTAGTSDSEGVTGFINYYQAVASTNSGLSANQSAVSAASITLWPNAPGVVPTPGGGTGSTPPSITGDTIGNASSVSLCWPTPVGSVSITGYQIYRSTTSGLPSTLLGAVPIPTQCFVDPNVNSGTAYYYWVSSLGQPLTSAYSSQASIIPLAPVTVNLTPGSSENVLNWLPPAAPSDANISGYVVYREEIAPQITPTFVQLTEIDGIGNTGYADGGTMIGDGTTYVYEVAAINGSQVQTPFSAPVTGVVYPEPVSLSAVSSDGLAQLRWNYQGQTTNSYILLRKIGTAPGAPQTYQTGLTGTNYTDTGLLDKNSYIYQMITVDAFGNSSVASSPATALPAAPPAVPDGIVTLGQIPVGNQLSWTPADPTTATGSSSVTFNPLTMYPLGGYYIYKSTDGGGTYEQSPIIVPAGSDTYTDAETLVGGSSWTYLVQAFDAPPDVDLTNSSMVHTTSYDPVTAYPLSSGNALDRNAIRPFGASNEQKVDFRIAVNQAGTVTIRVYTLTGTFVKQVVSRYFSQGVHSVTTDPDLYWNARNMNGSLVASGVYLITTDMSGHQEFDKVAVIK